MKLSKKMPASRSSRVFDERGFVRRATANHLIRKSNWWVEHPAGKCLAPKMAEKIVAESNEWVLHYGSNVFHVSEAIRACVGAFQKMGCDGTAHLSAEQVAKFEKYCDKELRKCVSQKGKTRFSSYGSGEFLRFGAHGVSVLDFSSTLIAILTGDQFGPYRNLALCEPRLTKCQWCNDIVRDDRLRKHQKNACSKRPLGLTDDEFEKVRQIPNSQLPIECEACGKIIAHYQASNHSEKCVGMQIKCEYCPAMIHRNKVDAHRSVCPHLKKFTFTGKVVGKRLN